MEIIPIPKTDILGTFGHVILVAESEARKNFFAMIYSFQNAFSSLRICSVFAMAVNHSLTCSRTEQIYLSYESTNIGLK